MEQKPNKRPFTARNIATIRKEELLLAARWWARNAVIMSAADKWKSHAALLAIAPLLCESAVALAQWLEIAHRATGRTWSPIYIVDETTIYEQAWLELFSETPPWSPGHPLFETINEQWSRDMAAQELRRYVDEIRNDCHIELGLNKSPLVVQ